MDGVVHAYCKGGWTHAHCTASHSWAMRTAWNSRTPSLFHGVPNTRRRVTAMDCPPPATEWPRPPQVLDMYVHRPSSVSVWCAPLVRVAEDPVRVASHPSRFPSASLLIRVASLPSRRHWCPTRARMCVRAAGRGRGRGRGARRLVLSHPSRISSVSPLIRVGCVRGRVDDPAGARGQAGARRRTLCESLLV